MSITESAAARRIFLSSAARDLYKQNIPSEVMKALEGNGRYKELSEQFSDGQFGREEFNFSPNLLEFLKRKFIT